MSSMDYERWTEIVDRETSGEGVSADEQALAREFERADALAGAEAELFTALARESSEEHSSDSLAHKAVAVALSRRAERARASVRRVAATGLVLAAAAGAALWITQAKKPAVTAALPLSTVEYLDGRLTVNANGVQSGAHIAVGSEVAAVSGTACVAVEPKIHVCISEGSKIRITSVEGATKEVSLLSGRLATALDPLAPGQHYSILAGSARVTAVGTAFTVEKIGDSVRTIVHEGKVRVGDPVSGELVTAHKIGLSAGSGTSVTDLVEHGPTETPDWQALAKVAHRSIEASLGTARPAPEALAPATETPAEATPAHAQPERREAKVHAPEAVDVPAPTAGDLLARARQALRNQSWSEAASAYQELIGTYPSSPEARAAVVPLAGLEIDRLGQPAVALGHLDAYLASPGALSMEARLARIRALRALGRTVDEAHAIDEFLEEHPNSLEAPRLRERRDALSH